MKILETISMIAFILAITFFTSVWLSLGWHYGQMIIYKNSFQPAEEKISEEPWPAGVPTYEQLNHKH